jgi:hypothetical protein
MIYWWGIEFFGSHTGTGYMKMQDGNCLGVYFEDGTPVAVPVEYTCVKIDGVVPPPWA